MNQKSVGLNEALGRKESELFSTLIGQEIVISGVEFSDFTDKDGKTVKTAYISLEGIPTLYRSSGKAIIDTLTKLQDVLSNQTVSCKVAELKSKGSKFKYIALTPVETEQA